MVLGRNLSNCIRLVFKSCRSLTCSGTKQVLNKAFVSAKGWCRGSSDSLLLSLLLEWLLALKCQVFRIFCMLLPGWECQLQQQQQCHKGSATARGVYPSCFTGAPWNVHAFSIKTWWASEEGRLVTKHPDWCGLCLANTTRSPRDQHIALGEVCGLTLQPMLTWEPRRRRRPPELVWVTAL